MRAETSFHLGYGALIAPSASTPTVDQARIKFVYLRPFALRFGLPVYGQSAVTASIAGLFVPPCPSDVTGCVMAVHVNTIKRMRWRRFLPHFTQKLLKRFKTKLNSSSTIQSVAIAAGVAASTFRLRKGHIFRCSGQMVRSATSRQFPIQTPARAGTTASQARLCYNAVFSALALAQIVKRAVFLAIAFAPQKPLHSQASICLPCKIDPPFAGGDHCEHFKRSILHSVILSQLSDVQGKSLLMTGGAK